MKPRAETNLVDVIRSQTGRLGAKCVLEFRDDRDQETGSCTYEQIDRTARAIGALLQGYRQQQRPVLLCVDAGEHFVASFLGCLYGGAIAVPTTVGLHPRYIDRLRRMVADCRPTVGLTTSAIAAALKGLGHIPELSDIMWLTVDQLPSGMEGLWQRPEIQPDWISFLQYTSGSTGQPKGAMVSHRNLEVNLAQIAERFRFTEAERMLSWLPPFHDMGLVGGILSPLYNGASVVLCSPAWFARQPSRWLERIALSKITLSGAPNFAYELCIRRGAPGADHDLSSWELAFCGAEPIRASTIERFIAKFSPLGFRPRSFFACYGLAEATLLVTSVERGSGSKIATFERERYGKDVVVPSDDGGEQEELRLVSCGTAASEVDVVIVDPVEQRVLPAGGVGEIWVRGDNVVRGYWNRSDSEREFAATLREAPAGVPEGPYLRTGDRGFMVDGELYVSGRIKDMMIFHGQNHYPQDIEETVDTCHKALRPGCGAAFSVPHAGEERLAIVYELADGAVSSPDVEAAVSKAVWDGHGISLYALALIPKSTVPKTSSGKIMRHAARAAFQGGTLNPIASWTKAEIEAVLPGAAELDPAGTSISDEQG